MRNLRKVLRRKGYDGDALEERVKEVLQRDVSRVAAVLWGATPLEATNMTIDQRLAFIKARQKTRPVRSVTDD